MVEIQCLTTADSEIVILGVVMVVLEEVSLLMECQACMGIAWDDLEMLGVMATIQWEAVMPKIGN